MYWPEVDAEALSVLYTEFIGESSKFFFPSFESNTNPREGPGRYFSGAPLPWEVWTGTPEQPREPVVRVSAASIGKVPREFGKKGRRIETSS